MPTYNRRSLVGQRSSSKAESTTISLLQQSSRATNPIPYSRSHHPKSTPRLPLWACHPPPASLDRNLHYDRLAQFLHIQHSPPPTYLPSDCASEIADDPEEDDEPQSRTIDTAHGPVPTKWLMLGYSRVAEAPTSPPIKTAIRRNRLHDGSQTRAQSLSDASLQQITASCATAERTQADWMEGVGVQIMGALTLFLMIVLITEGARSLWRNCVRRRSSKGGGGRLTLEGDEQQLRAFMENTGAGDGDALTGVNLSV